jgi:hypothetical protein
MNRRPVTSIALAALAVGCLCGRITSAQDRKPDTVLPVFEVDSGFPTMPDHLLLGGVGGATADSHGNVWVFHRPHTLEEGNATENGYAPAPPVLQFMPTGRYVQGWGGPIKAGPYEWFNRGGLHSSVRRVRVLHGATAPERRWASWYRRARHCGRCRGQRLAHRQWRRRWANLKIHQRRKVSAADRQRRCRRRQQQHRTS